MGDGARGEGLDFALGTAGVDFFVPAGEGGKEDEADECEDYGDDSAFIVSISIKFVDWADSGILT